ncbi:hypothetical protein EYR36_011560 [Pleurotus pulmonarius]|nr:hypothetical protein EYR36_011560 [Pleurotus pulmonarius]
MMGKSLLEYLASFFETQSFFSETDVCTVNATVPIIVEQKRPPSRHPRDILAYYTQVQDLLKKASKQASDQGHCLFSMPRFGHQEQVMLIAASGVWWRFCLKRRADVADRIFNFTRFRETHLSRADEDDDAVDDESDLLTTPAEAEESATKREEARRQERQKSGSDAREERMRRRDQLREEIWKRGDAKDRLKKFVGLIGKGPYTLEELDECSRLVEESQGNVPVPFSNQFDGELQIGDPRLIEWSGPMRLGTPVSDKYMAFIKNILADLAKNEERRRNGGGAQ